MATATLPKVWRGRSGVEYRPADGSRVRHGGMATVRRVVCDGVADVQPLALKLWHEGDDASLDALQAEAELLEHMSQRTGEIPCPRLFDVIGQPLVTGLVMEWCPADLERWWRDKLTEPDAVGRLLAALGEVAHRLADYHDYTNQAFGHVIEHGDLKPSNVLLSTDGRWLVSDFGGAQVRKPEPEALVTRVVMGTENFLSPEAVFHARKPFPAAIDTWALAATLFSLLRLRRLVLDGSSVPRNGTHNPKFRMQRVSTVIEVYAKDPTRFAKRDLDAGAFPDPLGIPDEDRRSLRECLKGAMGEGGAGAEADFAGRLLEVADRAMSIDPSHRFTSARDLGAAFEKLARDYVALSTLGAATTGDVPIDPPPQLAGEVADLSDRLGAMEAETRRIQLPSRKPVSVVPGWWSLALVAILLMQGLSLLLGTVIAILVALT